MSTNFNFYTKIKLSEVSKKTNIVTVYEDDNIYLRDKSGNVMHVNKRIFTKENSSDIDEDTFDLTRYGLNDPTSIINELVKVFNLKFLTDDDELVLYYDKNIDIDKYINECMVKYGY